MTNCLHFEKRCFDSSVDFKMLFKTILLLVIVTSAVQAQDSVKIPVAFRRVGKLATGLSYAHLRATIDFGQVQRAHKLLAQHLREELKTATSSDVRTFFEMVLNQLSLSSGQLDRLEEVFFSTQHHRDKRQLMGGLGLGMGIFGLGLSIYNLVEIKKLHREIDNFRDGFNHVLHALEDTDHAIATLTSSVNSIKRAVSIVISEVENGKRELEILRHSLLISNMIQHHNVEISLWARGLESVLQKQLQPTLVKSKQIRHGLEEICHKAKKQKLNCLSEENSAIFKMPISYFATEDKKIYVFIHIPLIDREPINLYQHLPTPVKIGNLFFTLHSGKQFLATDSLGVLGMELSDEELSHCHRQNLHSGITFLCPNTNLIRLKIKKTCLGALLFGLKDIVPNSCKGRIQSQEEKEEKAVQISETDILLYNPQSETYMEHCPNGSRTLPSLKKVAIIKTSPGCQIVMNDFVFRAAKTFQDESDFVDQPMEIDWPKMANSTFKDLETAFNEMERLQDPKRTDLHQLKKWINDNKNERAVDMNFVVAAIALTASVVIVLFLCILYISHKRSK